MKTKLSQFVAAALLMGSSVLSAEPVVIINAANQTNVTKEDVKKLYLGKIKRFSNGNKAVVFSLSEKTEIKSAFNKKVLGKSASQFKSYWSQLIFTGKAKPPKELSSEAAVKEAVANEVNAIGIVDSALVDEKVKVVLKF